MDIIGPLLKTKCGNIFVLVIRDYFTKWTRAFAIPDQEAVTVARVVVEEFICRFVVPRQLYTDKGSNFESQMFHQICKLLDIDKTRTTSRRPQSDGMVECFNWTLERMLTMYVEKKPNRWDEYLPYVMLAYRSTIHESTSFSPSMMMLGCELELPLQVVIPRPKEDHQEDVGDFVQDVQEKIKQVHETARHHLKRAAQLQKNYDHRANTLGRKFQEGQAVWYHKSSLKAGRCRKFNSHWKGPYTVTEVIDDVIYQTQLKPRTKPIVCHVDTLKNYERSMPLTWNQN